MQVYQCLEKGAKCSGKLFLTASAGTGKTFAIEHIVVKKILEGVQIDEILVVTFTREATRSLKRRIHANLSDVLDILVSKRSSAEHGLNYLEQVDIDEAKKLASRALANLDQAQIFTIHGFCLEMLSKYSLKESLQLSSSALDSMMQSDQRVLQEIVMLLRKSDKLDFCLTQKSMFIEQTNKDLHKLVDKLKPLLFGSVEIIETRSFCQILADMPKLELNMERVLTDLEILKKHFKGLSSQSGQIHKIFIDQIEALIERRFDELIGYKPSIFSLLVEDNRKKSFGLDRADLNYWSLFFQEGIKIEELLQEASSIENLNHRFCHLMKADFDVKGSLFFADKLLHRMRGALEDKDFCQRVRSSYKAVIVDEFQDTDEVQYAIFKTLFGDAKEHLFCVVGDEKQSIYAFRGADLDTFERAKHDFTGNHFKLDSNYRSSRGVIEGLERLFEGFTCQDQEDIAFDFQKVYSKARGVQELEASLEFFLHEKGACPLISIFNKIEQLKKEHGLKDASFAFLVKDRFQAAKIYSFLKAKGASVDALVKESLFDAPAFFWVMLLLEFIDTRSSATKKALLVHPMIGLGSTYFQEGGEGEPLFVALKALDTIAQAFDEKGLGAAFSTALCVPLFYGGLTLQEGLVARDRMQDFFALKKVIQMIVSESLEKALGIKDLIAHLKKILRENRQDPSSLLDVVSGPDSMSIMTSHASKGLEFDVVIPIGLMLETKLKGKLSKAEAIEIDREKMRLFYVALTRAKKKLLMPITYTEKNRSLALGSASPWDLFFARSQGSCSYEELYQRIQGSSDKSIRDSLEGFTIHDSISQALQIEAEPAASRSLYKPSTFKGLNYETTVHSFSSLYKKQKPLYFDELEPSALSGRLFGSLMHKILEFCVSKGFHHPFNEKNILNLIERYVKFTPLKSESAAIFEMVKYTFFRPIDKDLCLADIPRQHMHLEEAFMMHSKDNLDLKGFVDLVVIHNKRLYIIDYKTHHLPSYNEAMLQRVIQHYQYNEQLLLYKQACSRFIHAHNLDITKIETLIIFVRSCFVRNCLA